MEIFYEETHRAAEDIRKGSLYEGDDPAAMQVHKSSWQYLAEINDLGMITWISQDAIDWQTGMSKTSERAYVCGFMPIAAAKEFVMKFNLSSNSMIATLAMSIDPQLLGHCQRVGSCVGITNRDLDTETEKWKTRGLLIGLADHRMKREGIIGVHVMDAKWGRSATGRKGLWKAVIRALSEIQET